MRKTVVALLLLVVMCIVPVTAMELGGISDPTPVPTHMSLDAIDTGNLSVTPDLPIEWRNILLLCTDTGDLSKNARTDIIMIASINTADGRVKLTNIMGDMVVPITTMSGKRKEVKISDVVSYGGNEAVMKTINGLFGMNITEYVVIDFAHLQAVVDALGGIYIDVSPDERKAITKSLRELTEYLVTGGPEKPKAYDPDELLNGQQAIDYTRIQHADGGDVQPSERQKIVLQAIFDKMKDASINQISQVASQWGDAVSVNIDIFSAVNIATSVIEYDSEVEMNGYIPDASTTQMSEMRDGVWGIYDVDFEANKLLLNQYIYSD